MSRFRIEARPEPWAGGVLGYELSVFLRAHESILVSLVAQAEPVDAPCGQTEEAGALCSGICDLTGNEALAQAGEPLAGRALLS